MPNRFNDNVVEIWRSRKTGRDMAYFRYITHTGDDVPPDYGKAPDVAQLLATARQKYGKPKRIIRYNRGNGRITRYVWARTPGKRFKFCPSDWDYTGARGFNENHYRFDAAASHYWDEE